MLWLEQQTCVAYRRMHIQRIGAIGSSFMAQISPFDLAFQAF
jgi:hypothetical protein